MEKNALSVVIWMYESEKLTSSRKVVDLNVERRWHTIHTKESNEQHNTQNHDGTFSSKPSFNKIIILTNM